MKLIYILANAWTFLSLRIITLQMCAKQLQELTYQWYILTYIMQFILFPPLYKTFEKNKITHILICCFIGILISCLLHCMWYAHLIPDHVKIYQLVIFTLSDTYEPFSVLYDNVNSVILDLPVYVYILRHCYMFMYRPWSIMWKNLPVYLINRMKRFIPLLN